jgi:Plavaka transposase
MSDAEEPPLSTPFPSISGRPQRTHQLPARFRDILPEPPRPATSTPLEDMAISRIPRISLIVRNPFRTTENSFGLWKEYQYRPSYDPDAIISIDDLYRPHTSTILPDVEEMQSDPTCSANYSSKTAELLLDWQNTKSTSKSNGELDRLVHTVLLHPEFQLDDLRSFNATRENRKVDAAEEKSAFLSSFQWADLDIEVPSGAKGVPPRALRIPGMCYRKIVTVIEDAFKSHLSGQFHLTPYKLFRKLRNGEDKERVYSEMYDSDAFLDEHDRVQRAPTDHPSCKREKVVVALMFWSDATHLAAFGTAKMWPIYMLFGNLSKYVRCQPNSGATKHVAYIPPFPDSLQDDLKEYHHKWNTQQKDILAHCRRELMHAVWKFLLDDDFIHAYKYGMIIRCQDGIERRVYPRVFTYSADYPEKSVFYFFFASSCLTLIVRVLLATIRDKGLCPCPRCLVTKSKLDRLGLISDTKLRIVKARKYNMGSVKKARKAIYELGKPIGGVHVQGLLKATSAVPTSVSLRFILCTDNLSY